MALGSESWFKYNDRWNSLLRIGEKQYRHRVECLILKGNTVFVSMDGNSDYHIPGGSTEPDVPDMNQAIKECQEEAHITPTKLIKYGRHIEDFDINHPIPKWMEKLPERYDGVVTDVYVGLYKEDYMKHVDPKDVSKSIAKGSFVPIDEALKFLRSEHCEAINQYLSGKVMGKDRIKSFCDAMESSLRSELDPNYKARGQKKLSDFKRLTLTDEVCKRYKDRYKFLRHIMTQNRFRDAVIWIDDRDNVVATISVIHPDSSAWKDPSQAKLDGHHWIQAFEITPEYRGYGLSKQCLDYATKILKGDALGVHADNKIAQKVYLDYGFKLAENTRTSKQTNLIMYLK